MQSRLSDDELADRWETQDLGGTGSAISTTCVLLGFSTGGHGALEAEDRLVEGTRKGCDHYGVPEKFDENLTRLWAQAISTAVRDARES